MAQRYHINDALQPQEPRDGRTMSAKAAVRMRESAPFGFSTRRPEGNLVVCAPRTQIELWRGRGLECSSPSLLKICRVRVLVGRRIPSSLVRASPNGYSGRNVRMRAPIGAAGPNGAERGIDARAGRRGPERTLTRAGARQALKTSVARQQQGQATVRRLEAEVRGAEVSRILSGFPLRILSWRSLSCFSGGRSFCQAD